MHSFEVHSNESACIKSGHLGLEQVHGKIRESLLRIAGVGSFLGTSNQCNLGLVYQQAGRYAPAAEIEIIRFCTLPFGDLV